MCGFAGFYNRSRSQFSADTNILDRMQQAIAHRGPDAEGVWTSDEFGIGLASRRLKIIDLSDAANQPMLSEQYGVVLSYNGEIYNHMQLRKELEKLGFHYKTTSDTETIITAYRAWGISCLDRFEGMFALALFDLQNQHLFLVRDRLGVKPLYFSLQNGVLTFASEIKALWHAPWMEKKINTRAWYHYLTFMVAPAPLTIFDGVYKLPAGFYMQAHGNTLNFNEWYSPVKQTSVADKRVYAIENDCIQRVQELLIDSTKKRMLADVPVGAYLSGGLDSSLNVALMSQFSNHIKTFTIAFADDASHELGWARRVANHFGTEHYELVITEKQAFDFYPTMVEQLDEPLADCVCIPFYYLSRLAHDHGMKVVQVGEGADELFFGYQTYARYAQMFSMLSKVPSSLTPSIIKKMLARCTQLFYEAQPIKHELLQNWADNKALFWSGAVAFGEVQKQDMRLMRKSMSSHHDPVLEQIYPGMRQDLDSYAVIEYHLSQLEKIYPEADFAQQMMYLELKQRLPELLLMRADKMSMATSIEAREPYLDHHLVEFMFHVPAALRFKNNTTKYLLKKAAERFLPHEIIYRSKVGFAAPTFHWFEHGQHFPEYFKRLALQGSGIKGFRAGAFVDEHMNSNTMHRAVQNWVLQQLWAFSGR